MVKCPVSDCEFESDSGRGVSIHASQKHPEKDVSFTNKTKFTCFECGDTFEDYESRRTSKDEKHNFCKKKCKREFEKNGENVECSWCGESNYRAKSSLDEMGDYSIDNHFCDKLCEQSWKQEHWTGENHPSWDGGSPTHRGKSWPEMRRKAINRDGYKCKICDMTREEHYNKYGQDLDVHHKIPAKKFEQADDSNYLINLLTTCRSCHGQLDKISRREANRKPSISNKQLT